MKNLVLENQFGQTVRYFKVESNHFYLIHRMDTQRVESVTDLTELEKKKISFQILKEVKVSELAKSPVEISKGRKLKLVDEINEVSLNLRPDPDSNEPLKKAFKVVAIANVCFLIFAFILSYFVGKEELPPMQVVKISPRPELPTVAPMKNKNVFKPKTKIANRVVKKTRTKSLRPKVARKAPSMSVNQMGALGVLGSLKGKSSSGLKVNSLKSSRGPGLGGEAGSGGSQTSLYAKGLVGASLGAGHNVRGGGGYGTRGKGGGQAGYGTLSLVGSSGAYFQPVTEEASVEGGLDRDEIAAVIQRHIGQIRFCYEQGLQSAPKLSGRVAVNFVISGSGFVHRANVSSSSLKNQSVEGCIVQRLKTWKFPEPRGGVNVRVTYPFVLKRISQS